MQFFKKLFENKGQLATVIGLLFALPINIKTTIDYFNHVSFEEKSLTVIVTLNILAMCWFILPSVIEIKSKIFTFRIED